MRLLIPLFSPPSGTWGSLTRVLAVANEAAARGYAVAFCASGSLADRLAGQGWRVYRMPASTFFGLPGPISRLIGRRSQDASPPVRPGRDFGDVWLVLRLSGMASRRYLCALVGGQLAAVRDFRPDLLFTEMDPGAFITARIAGLPLASTWASVLRRGIGGGSWKAMARSAAAACHHHGVPPAAPEAAIDDTAVLKLIPSIPELEETVPDRDDFRFTGSLLGPLGGRAEAGFEPPPGKRLVFAYTGTGSIPLARLRKVLPAVFPADSDTVCLVGHQSVTGEERAGNVIFRPYFDAAALMPRCDWVICHGGHNTIMQSLGCGVPLAIFPGPIFERRFNARMVVRSGAGVMGELPDFCPDRLRELFSRREDCMAAARRLSREIKGYDGPRRALDAMEHHAAALSRHRSGTQGEHP
jgi:UDP:flavonoid glycosyltransferase YjiC (YdhE family)